MVEDDGNGSEAGLGERVLLADAEISKDGVEELDVIVDAVDELEGVQGLSKVGGDEFDEAITAESVEGTLQGLSTFCEGIGVTLIEEKCA